MSTDHNRWKLALKAGFQIVIACVPVKISIKIISDLQKELDSLLYKVISGHPFWNISYRDVIPEITEYLNLRNRFYSQTFVFATHFLDYHNEFDLEL